MGNPLFGVNISKLIKDNVGTGVLDATLTVVTNTTRLAGSLTAGRRPTEATHACKGFIDSQQVRDVNGTLVDDGTKLIILIGDTINGGATAPGTADKITIEGDTYNIEAIDRDPAAATYSCTCRKI